MPDLAILFSHCPVCVFEHLIIRHRLILFMYVKSVEVTDLQYFECAEMECEHSEFQTADAKCHTVHDTVVRTDHSRLRSEHCPLTCEHQPLSVSR